jgi:hypothetical protein
MVKTPSRRITTFRAFRNGRLTQPTFVIRGLLAQLLKVELLPVPGRLQIKHLGVMTIQGH